MVVEQKRFGTLVLIMQILTHYANSYSLSEFQIIMGAALACRMHV